MHLYLASLGPWLCQSLQVSKERNNPQLALLNLVHFPTIKLYCHSGTNQHHLRQTGSAICQPDINLIILKIHLEHPDFQMVTPRSVSLFQKVICSAIVHYLFFIVNSVVIEPVHVDGEGDVLKHDQGIRDGYARQEEVDRQEMEGQRVNVFIVPCSKHQISQLLSLILSILAS